MENNENKNGKFNSYWIYGLLALFLLALNFYHLTNGSPELINSEKFDQMVRDQDVKSLVVVNKEFVQIYIHKDKLDKYPDASKSKLGGPTPHFVRQIGNVDIFKDDLNAIYEEAKISPSEQVRLDYKTEQNWLTPLLGWVLPILIIIGIWVFIMRRVGGGAGGPGAQIFNIGKSKATLFDSNAKVTVTFEDVAGLDEAKEEVMEVVDFLKHPKKYTALGGKIPKGVLLVGPPGTGKTLLAKAVAGEAKVPFFSLSGSDFVEMFVGVGASRVRDLFKQAAQKSPSIIFIDEIDAIGRARGRSNITGGNDERENTLNQLLTEMDGFKENKGVIVVGATNRVDILDAALLRPGRFDRQITVGLPDRLGRIGILKVHAKNKPFDKNVSLVQLANRTPGFSGADIANVCNEAALIAARKNKKAVNKQDFLDAVDRIVGGLEKKNKIITQKEKETIAYHEAGHATVSWMLEHAAPLVKVTIVPRGQALGAAWYLPEERMIVRTEQMLDEMCATLGGRAAEKIIFDKISTGALSDLEKITKQARAMVAVYGLSEKLGNITYYDSSGQNDYNFSKPYSEETAQLIDEEISKLIEAQYQRAQDILTKHKKELTQLAELLLEKEVIFSDDLETIFGKRPFVKEPLAKKVVKTATPAASEEPQKDVNNEGEISTEFA